MRRRADGFLNAFDALVNVHHYAMADAGAFRFTKSEDFQFSEGVLTACNGYNFSCSDVKAYNNWVLILALHRVGLVSVLGRKLI